MFSGGYKEGGPVTSEATLFLQAQGGCRESLNRLMARHDGLVHSVVRQRVFGELSYEEALQAGRTGLWRAILGYDPHRGLAFSTYAWPCIMRQCWREVKLANRFGKPPPKGDDVCRGEEGEDPAVLVEREEVKEVLYGLVRRLPGRLRRVIVMRYGLDGSAPALYREIGEVLGRSGELARLLHTEALVLLRHPAGSQELRAILGLHTTEEYETADELAQEWLRRRGGRNGR